MTLKLFLVSKNFFENENLRILPMYDDNYPSKRAGEKCTPIAISPSTSKFSIQGLTAFDLATKAIDPSRLGKTKATPSFDLIHMPSRDVTRNKSISVVQASRPLQLSQSLNPMI